MNIIEISALSQLLFSALHVIFAALTYIDNHKKK